MENPLVSIIIPVLNAERYICETVQSVLEQVYGPIEIIIVDNGSTDGTTDFFEMFEKQGIICIQSHNGGASHARNVGFKASKGIYIQYLDADDLLHPEKIALQVEMMQETNAQVSFCLWTNFEVRPNENMLFKYKNVFYTKPKTGLELIQSFGMENWFIPVFSWLTKRELIEKAGLWNDTLTNNDDGEFFCRVLTQVQLLVCIDKVLGYYRSVPGTESLSKLNSSAKIESALRSYSLILEHLESFGSKKSLSYPKRLYYQQFKFSKDKFPLQAKIAAKAFDQIKAPSFLSKRKKYWKLVEYLGLYRGTIFYDFAAKLRLNF